MKDLKKQKRWVVWNMEAVAGGRTTKVPYSIRGARASSTDPDTWGTYEQVKKAQEFFSGIGVVFTPEQTLLGVDMDHVLGDDRKLLPEHKKVITDFLAAADSYTDVSPSGHGIHVYLEIEEALELEANRHAPFEAYTSGRYFTFSEDSYHKRPKPIRKVSKKEALELLAILGYPWKSEGAASAAGALLDGSADDDADVLERMFRSKNGEAIKKLYEGDVSAYQNDESRADAALLNHLAFFSRKNGEQMERLWLKSPLGSREKTQKRQDYRDRSIKAAIATCKEVYKSQPERIREETGIEFLTMRGAKGEEIIIQNTENVCRVLREHDEFRERFRHDVFSNIFETRDSLESDWRQFEDVDAIHTQTRIQVLFPFFIRIGKDMVYDAILQVMSENRYDSALDHIRSIAWDGEKRLDTWLSKVFAVEDSEYHRAVASNWLKGLVKRIVHPGCKFDYVLVLEGEQGVKKSTSLHVLGALPNGRNMHVETTMGVDNKDFFMQFQGKAIVEFSEGETLSRTEVKKLKAIITTQSDKYRPPYSRVSQDFPRRCVFAMTTNQEEYLKDETGNRRWLPVKVLAEKADVEWLEENRDQLFAEAYHRVVELKETIYEFPEEETRKQQEARRISDPNAEKIADWYFNDQFLPERAREEGITIEMVYRGALSGFGPMKKFDEMAIADVLKNHLGLEKKRSMLNGVQSNRWFNPRKVDLDALELPAPAASDEK